MWDKKKKTITDSLPGITYNSMPIICFVPTLEFE